MCNEDVFSHLFSPSVKAEDNVVCICPDKLQMLCNLLLDLSADWCRECKEMDRTTFADPAVAAEAARFPAALRVDCTDADSPRIRDLLRRLEAPGLPFSAILAPPPPPAP